MSSVCAALSDAPIRATARIQEAHEPPRQKPIIKLDATMAHINEANQLASNIRASIDSGRDNPFRPDGEIYKLTNPIVDYYKYGPNQSRAATPTYAELDYFSSKNKRKRRAEAKRQRDARRPCWRRWLCCCCNCCNCCDGSPERSGAGERPGDKSPSEALSGPGKETADATKIIEEAAKRVTADGTDLKQAPASLAPSKADDKLKRTKKETSNKTKPNTKKVVLDEASQPQKQNSKSQPDKATSELPETTTVKTVKTSRCVIS